MKVCNDLIVNVVLLFSISICRALDKSAIEKNSFLILNQNNVVGTQKNRLNETIHLNATTNV